MGLVKETAFIQPEKFTSKPVPLFQEDWHEKINQYIHVYLTTHQLILNVLNRYEKKALNEHLCKVNMFSVINAAQDIAQIIGVSCATIYNYLKLSLVR